LAALEQGRSSFPPPICPFFPPNGRLMYGGRILDRSGQTPFPLRTLSFPIFGGSPSPLSVSRTRPSRARRTRRNRLFNPASPREMMTGRVFSSVEETPSKENILLSSAFGMRLVRRRGAADSFLFKCSTLFFLKLSLLVPAIRQRREAPPAREGSPPLVTSPLHRTAYRGLLPGSVPFFRTRLSRRRLHLRQSSSFPLLSFPSPFSVRRGRSRAFSRFGRHPLPGDPRETLFFLFFLDAFSVFFFRSC